MCVFWILFGWALFAGRASSSSFREKYPSIDEIDLLLEKVISRFPKKLKKTRLGYSYRGEPITMVQMGRSGAQSILVNSLHHGDEKITLLAALGLIDFLASQEQAVPVRQFLESFEIVIVPVVNPDGYKAHTRVNAQGLDINRDYIPDDPKNGFRTPEARILRDLALKRDFVAALALHSGDEAVFWPLGDSPKPPDHAYKLAELAKSLGQTIGFQRWMQSYYDYPTKGEFIDYVYRNHGTLGLTFELSYDHEPPTERIPGIVSKSLAGILGFFDHLARAH